MEGPGDPDGTAGVGGDVGGGVGLGVITVDEGAGETLGEVEATGTAPLAVTTLIISVPLP